MKEHSINTPFNEPPLWAQKAVWYQIFVERFRRSGFNNEPTLKTLEGALIDPIPDDWQMTPWGHNWYKQEDWAKNTGLGFYRTIQMRRYGGDLQGVLEKIPYLKKLGINAVYFNPLNDAPSLHKYDARNYHHIDVCFGNDREGDLELMSTEEKDNPTKWVWTSADKLFLQVIRELHQHDIKIVLDFSWNHTGTQFWAFQDIIKNGNESKYKTWYDIHFENDSMSTEKNLKYEGWFGISSLPEIRKIKDSEKIYGFPYEGNIDPMVKKHIFEVCRRWMDPNGDGNPEDGIDGMRLDVAEHVPLGFWRDLRKFVRNINPDFYLVGENWWESWPDQLMNPTPWISGDVFDAIMHYHWFMPARQYFNQGDDKITLLELIKKYKEVYAHYRLSSANAMMNIASSHDSERVLSSLYNTNKYKFLSKPSENKNYKTDQPDKISIAKLYTLLLHQFTFIGSPHIWNGDEMGMWGADDPDNRKPLIWPDITFEAETPLGLDDYEYKNTPKFNEEIFNLYTSLCSLRKTHKALQLGNITYDESLAVHNIFSYTRSFENEEVTIIINAENKLKHISAETYKNQKPIFSLYASYYQSIMLPPYSGIVLKNKS
jgi:glycosidase